MRPVSALPTPTSASSPGAAGCALGPSRSFGQAEAATVAAAEAMTALQQGDASTTMRRVSASGEGVGGSLLGGRLGDTDSADSSACRGGGTSSASGSQAPTPTSLRQGDPLVASPPQQRPTAMAAAGAAGTPPAKSPPPPPPFSVHRGCPETAPIFPTPTGSPPLLDSSRRRSAPGPAPGLLLLPAGAPSPPQQAAAATALLQHSCATPIPQGRPTGRRYGYYLLTGVGVAEVSRLTETPHYHDVTFWPQINFTLPR